MDEFIENLKEIKTDVDFENCTDLVTGGYLASLDIIQIVSMIYSKYGVKIPVSKLRPNSFNSAENIWKLISELLDE